MRVLVIGYPLPNPQIDNFNIVTSPSWFDYDGVLVEPLSISTVIEDVLRARAQHESRADEPVLNRPPTPFTAGLAEILRRRSDETRRVLENGGSVVVLARPNALHEGVNGFAGADRYFWLPAPPGVVYEPPFMLRAEGTDVVPADEAHPFAPLLRRHKGQIAYRVRFDETVSGFAAWGKVIARSSGGAAVGVELNVLNGKVVFLPAIGAVAYGDQRFQMADTVVEALRRLRGRRAGPAPAWVRNVTLPNTELLENAAAQARDDLAQAQEQLARTEEELEQATRLRGLLWLESADELLPLVREAFKTIGFDVEQSDDRPFWIGDGALRAFVEIEGATGAVDISPYVRLARRLDADLVAGFGGKRGLIVVNGQRELLPETRTAQFNPDLKTACENRHVALLTTTRLLEMARAVLETPYDVVLRSVMRSQLLNAVGVVGPEIVPQPPEPEPEPEADAAAELEESAAGDAGEPQARE